MRRRAPFAAIVVGVAALAVSTIGMLKGVEPFASWYYQFAWFPTILALDGLVAVTGGAGERGRFLLLDNPRHLLSLLFWSAIVWLYYEAFNFRLQNWYYVFLPRDGLLRFAGTFIAFTTVLPALFTTEAVLHGLGVAKRVSWWSWRVTPGFLTGMRVTGALLLALVLVLPKYFFPFVWIGTALLVEPVVYQRDPARSLLGDLERGRPGRVLRLLLAGAIVGLMWELFNIEARAKWIYTVPFFDELKLFEMPLLGFLGFPPFTLECFVVWQFLVTSGLAVDRDGRQFPAPLFQRVGGWIAAAAFAVAVLAGIDARTVESRRPRLRDLVGVPGELLETAGFDAFRLADADPGQVPAASDAEALEWIARARLATLRGIGVENANALAALGIETIDALAAADAESLAVAVGTLRATDLPVARARVWVRGARRAAAR